MDDEELSELLRDLVQAACRMAENVEIIADAVNPELSQRVREICDDDDA